MSIRKLLVGLVLAIWLPSVVGIALLAWSTYEREAEDAAEDVRRTADTINSLVERELDKRVVLARSLAASSTLIDGDLRRFHAEAALAAADQASWVVLATPTEQVLNTRTEFRPGQSRPRPADLPFALGDPIVTYVDRSPSSGQPMVAIYAAEAHHRPPRYNVAVALDPKAIQAVLDKLALGEGRIVAVVNRDQRVIARSRDAQKWLGTYATPQARERAAMNRPGFVKTPTLEGVDSLIYVSPGNRYGWTVLLALSESALEASAWRLTAQAAGASVVLLLLGLAAASWFAGRVGGAVLALKRSAERLGEDAVPGELATGVLEADLVGRVLHQSGLRARDATRVLEQRVHEAVASARDAQAKLLESQKHEAIGRLTGGLAHDFNNLLQTVNTALYFVHRTSEEGTPQRRMLQAGLGAVRKASDLVRQMQTFGRMHALKPVPLAMQDFLLRSHELTSKALEGRIQLQASIDPDLPPLHVDEAQLELALLNLVFNARDALPQGGTVRIVARRAGEADLEGLDPGSYGCIEVSDDGSGMDEATCEKAFDPYFTTKPVGSGSGLGLAQVRAFARHSGGEARLCSTPGRGTTVTLVLPVSDAAPRGATGAEATHARGRRPLRVLVAEDDVLVASVVVPSLEAAGHRVTLCATGDEAAATLARDPAFDVLFTDVVMPGQMSGIDLVAWCREHVHGLPALAATGYTAQQTVPGLRVLRKPYAMDELLQALDDAAQAGVEAAETAPC